MIKRKIRKAARNAVLQTHSNAGPLQNAGTWIFQVITLKNP